MSVMIRFDRASFIYDENLPQEVHAVRDISLDVERAGHVAILGRNGSGKSTVARLVNALLLAKSGTIEVGGIEPVDDETVYLVRRQCGMVFQNPDNQIVGTTVEEDVAFGPENLGMPWERMQKAVTSALDAVGLNQLRTRAPHELSGGQKQKLAIAGALAMQPHCLILDEATAMLDPESAVEFLQLVEQLRERRGLTVLTITHNMEEALLADYVYVVDRGRIALSGTPSDVFDNAATILQLGLDVPRHIEIASEIARRTNQPLLPGEAFTFMDAVTAVESRLESFVSKGAGDRLYQTAKTIQTDVDKETPNDRDPEEILISVDHLSHAYDEKQPDVKSLDDVSFTVKRGELLGIVGHSGSGKSTLIQHLNALIRPPKGKVKVLGLDASENKNIKVIRRHLGLLFQYPEHQLFEETVAKDIAFGLGGEKLTQEEIDLRVEEAARNVGLDKALLDRSPFELSGGQKRRAAIAGILVMRPDVLVLDEPAAGLDPEGKRDILNDALLLQKQGVTILIVSHNMDDIARVADRLLVLNKGRVHQWGTPAEVFSDEVRLQQAGLEVPRSMRFLQAFEGIYPGIRTDLFRADLAALELLRAAAEASHGA